MWNVCEPIFDDNFVQGSSTWLTEFRGKGIGGSDVAVLMSPEPVFGKTLHTLWNEKLGLETPEDISENENIKRGNRLEPVARAEFERQFKVKLTTPCVYLKEAPYARVSLDGYNKQGNFLVEFKCPSEAGFKKFLETGCVPDNYMAQIQYQLGVTQANFAFYAVYNESFSEKLLVTLVEKDVALQSRIQQRVELFIYSLRHRVPLEMRNGELHLIDLKPKIIIQQAPPELFSQIKRIPSSVPIFTNVTEAVENSFVLLTTNISDCLINAKLMHPGHSILPSSFEKTGFPCSFTDLQGITEITPELWERHLTKLLTLDRTRDKI